MDVSNFAGVTSSAAARLSVITPKGNLRIVDFRRGEVTLEASGPAGNRFAILTSTNLADWAALKTNSVPFTLRHTNPPSLGWRFYRAQPVP